jgi:hypothetical protein
MFFSLTGINISLTSFPFGYQTWENEENEFQKFVFLKTNNALEYHFFFFFIFLRICLELYLIIYNYHDDKAINQTVK